MTMLADWIIRGHCLLGAVLTAATISACCRKVPAPKGPENFHSSAALTLRCPEEASSKGPIPVEVTLDADARTYWDNQGILTDAVDIILVRRDRPGMLSVAKLDPAAMMLPSPPLVGRPSDKKLAEDASRVIENENYDVLAYGRHHDGAAEYFVIASFADAWAGPTRLKVVDPAGPLAPDESETNPAPAAPSPKSMPPATPGLFARIEKVANSSAVIGAFRTSAAKNAELMPFASIVMARLQPKGGISAGQFRLVCTQDKKDVIGSFAVPVAALNPSPLPGRYVLFVFVGDESTTPTVIEIP
jgi:hypothetical protein